MTIPLYYRRVDRTDINAPHNSRSLNREDRGPRIIAVTYPDFNDICIIRMAQKLRPEYNIFALV